MLRRRVIPVMQRYAPRLSAWLREWLWRRDRRGEYDVRRQQEKARFARDLDVGALPPIFSYWANTHMRPALESLGFSYPEDFYAKTIAGEAERLQRPLRLLSIGAGACDTEVRIAKLLLERGVDAWHFECVDLTAEMLDLGRRMAVAEGVADRFGFVTADVAEWRTETRYDVIIANQCLHHIFELERVFTRISELMTDDGVFVTCDIIGRNGHMRWPETLEPLDRFWQELPREYRWNVQLRRQENKFLDWDCSVAGFEGIRAQDILPLLVKRFDFEVFYACANLIMPFVDRNFGWHFDAEAAWDRDFIDRVHAADEAAIDAGAIKPTMMFAAMRHRRGIEPRIWKQRTPASCVRVPT